MEQENTRKTIQIGGVEFIYDTKEQYLKDGHVYCKTCNQQKDGEPLELLNKKMILSKECECDRKAKQAEEERKRQEQIIEKKRRCFIERNQENYTFENADEYTDKEIIRKAKNYVKHFEEMKKDNIGLLIYGGVGSGKTYLTCAIVNGIIETYLYDCKMMNFSQILNDLQKGGFELDRNEYIDNLTRKTLLVLDDFGIERNTEYALEQIYNIINARYQKQKPTIITTNIDYKTIETEQTDLMQSRIYSRLMEMCVPLKVTGNDRRKNKRKQKIDKAKELIG